MVLLFQTGRKRFFLSNRKITRYRYKRLKTNTCTPYNSHKSHELLENTIINDSFELTDTTLSCDDEQSFIETMSADSIEDNVQGRFHGVYGTPNAEIPLYTQNDKHTCDFPSVKNYAYVYD